MSPVGSAITRQVPHSTQPFRCDLDLALVVELIARGRARRQQRATTHSGLPSAQLAINLNTDDLPVRLVGTIGCVVVVARPRSAPAARASPFRDVQKV